MQLIVCRVNVNKYIVIVYVISVALEFLINTVFMNSNLRYQATILTRNFMSKIQTVADTSLFLNIEIYLHHKDI